MPLPDVSDQQQSKPYLSPFPRQAYGEFFVEKCTLFPTPPFNPYFEIIYLVLYIAEILHA